MKFMKVFLTTSAIVFGLGVITTGIGIGVAFANGEVEKLAIVEKTGEFEIDSFDKVNIRVAASEIKIVKTPNKTSFKYTGRKEITASINSSGELEIYNSVREEYLNTSTWDNILNFADIRSYFIDEELELNLNEKYYEKFKLDIAASSLEIDTINSNYSDIKVIAGDAEIDEIVATTKTSVEISAGNLEVGNLETDFMDLQARAATVTIDNGDIENTNLKLAASNLSSNYKGPKSDYNIDLISMSASTSNLEESFSETANRLISIDAQASTANINFK